MKKNDGNQQNRNGLKNDMEWNEMKKNDYYHYPVWYH